jgi:hypothetical protein
MDNAFDGTGLQILNVDAVVGSLHRVDVGNVLDFSKPDDGSDMYLRNFGSTAQIHTV